VLLAVIALGVPLAISLRDRADAEVRSQARSQADVVAASASEPLEHGRLDGLTRLTDAAARSVRGRVLITDAAGEVVADSAGSATVGADYSSRPEIAAALGGRADQQTRYSETLGIDILATAVPVVRAGRAQGAVRVTQSIEAVDHAVKRSLAGIALLGAVVLGLGIVAGALIAQRIASPIRRLADAADEVSAGDLDARARVEGSSEQRSLALSFNQMTTRLQRLLASQREFVADASHQLRTPLTGLRLQLEELEATTDSAGSRAAAESSIHEVDRLSAIVDELLILSRAGEAAIDPEPVSLGDAADRAARRWQRAAAARELELTRRTTGGPSIALCVSPDLDRALDAVIENAIAYARSGGTIEIVDASARIEVLDDGPGFDPEELDAVLERFYRGRAGRQGPEGTGLGLSIARELAQQWGGAVSVSNRPSGGAAVALEFLVEGEGGVGR
jgi:two-component system, OmpR family, sensor kinase